MTRSLFWRGRQVQRSACRRAQHGFLCPKRTPAIHEAHSSCPCRILKTLDNEDRTMAYFLRFAEAALLSLLVCGVAGAPPAAEKGQNGRRSDQKADEKARARAEPEADDEADPHVGLLKDAKIDTENANLIAYLKKHSQTDDDLQHLNRLVRQLGAPDFHERERASASLVKLGLVALATVREARTDANQEVARRAKDCVEQIEKESEHNVPLAVVRVLARRTPPGTFESLLNYLPFSIDQDVEEEIYRGLDRIAKKDGDGKARGALQNALKDDLPARRALAGCLLGRLGDEKQRIAVKGLLTDKEPIVRLRSAQGLLASGHLDAIPILIQLLEDASLDVAWQ